MLVQTLGIIDILAGAILILNLTKISPNKSHPLYRNNSYLKIPPRILQRFRKLDRFFIWINFPHPCHNQRALNYYNNLRNFNYPKRSYKFYLN